MEVNIIDAPGGRISAQERERGHKFLPKAARKKLNR